MAKLIGRHGDVLILSRVSTIPKSAKKVKNKVLAYGEVTGHCHEVDLGELFEDKDGLMYLKIDKFTKTSKLTHQEHKNAYLKPGTYLVAKKRQYNAAQDRWDNVAD